MYEQRNYLIFATSELHLIDFTQVCETSAETVRKSADESKTFVKWDGDAPAFVANLTTKEGPYTHSEILEVLNGPEWTLEPKTLPLE